ncbi:MAG: hypothetical protein KatS3mg121_0643 [Gammaproteobacteria bacterium]|nr:MAG: hypothetical protein KatS3mg121_0643 [Gammaproteobacteria bacterium]
MALKLLAGPIVRRVSADAAWVWIATSEALSRPRLILYGHDRAGGRWIRRSESLNAWSGGHHMQVTARFHVYLLAAAQRAMPGLSTTHERRAARLRHARLPHDMPIGYDVRWGEAADDEKGLAFLGALEGVVVPPFDRPTFIIQNPNRPGFRALYGSCRKFHGHGTDAIVAGEHVLRQNAGSMHHRPHVLLLGGDQIYADDVPDTLIRPIQGLARELMGGSEPLPGAPRPERLGIRERQAFVEGAAGFSSGEAANHLMTFGEFAAAYLMAWNPAVWPRSLPTAQQVARDIRPRRPLQEVAQEIADERRRVRDFQAATGAARRLLANVATYMMFDDHEVTDDWNLNADWQRRVARRPAGSRIMANALAAFWLFQAWGNDPDRLSRRSFMQSLASYANAPMQGGAGLEREFLHYHGWAFRTPTRPSAVFANTRTRRAQTRAHQRRFSPLLAAISPLARNLPRLVGLPAVDPMLAYRVNTAPRLMDAAERRRLRALLSQARRDDRRLLLVTATPLYGLDSLEFVQQIGPLLLDRLSAATALLDAILPETEMLLARLRSVIVSLSEAVQDPRRRASLLRNAEVVIAALARLPGLDELAVELRKAVQAYVRLADVESFHADPNSYFDVIDAVAAVGGRHLTVLSGDVHYGFSGAARLQHHGRALDIVQHTSSATKNEAYGGMRLILSVLQTGVFNPSERLYWWRSGDRTTVIPQAHPDQDIEAVRERAYRDEVDAQGAPHVSETFAYVPRLRVPGLSGFDQLAELHNNMGWLRLDARGGRHVLLAVHRPGEAPRRSIPYTWRF